MNHEISRESLLIYLEDLRTLETIVHESNKRKPQIEPEFCQKKEKLLNSIGEPRYVPFHEPHCLSEEKPISKSIFGVIIGIIFCIVEILFAYRFIVHLGHGEPAAFGYALVLIILFPLLLKGINSIQEIQNYKKIIEENEIRRMENERAYQEKLKEWELVKNEHHKKTSNTWEEIDKLMDKKDLMIRELDQEITAIQEKLNEAYSINIIPLPFRNIRGIYYLYDYLSTSQQSLSEALVQCNLEAIKEKLDSVINLQGKAIIQQAQANRALFEQNQKILETAQATMNNTAVTAKYAQICALNSAVSLEMQKQQLAYQKADYWLSL